MEWPAQCNSQSEWRNVDVRRTMGRMQGDVQTFLLRCPHCDSVQDCARKTLWKHYVWQSLVCQQCGVHSSSARWHCPCATRWADCSRHRLLGFACGSCNGRGNRAMLRVAHDAHSVNVSSKSSARGSAKKKCVRRAIPRLACSRRIQQNADENDMDFVVPPSPCSLSWLHSRPLKPGSVAWLVAIRNAASGERRLDMQAQPASADSRSPCEPSSE